MRVVTKTSHDLPQLVDYPVVMHEEIENGLMQGDPLIENIFVGGENRTDPTPQGPEIGEVLSIKNGFGFIKYPNNNLFFHCQDVIGDFTELRPEDKVEFSIEKNAMKQNVAKNVRKLSDEELFDIRVLTGQDEPEAENDPDWAMKW
jgi:cold shock CspA family protein